MSEIFFLDFVLDWILSQSQFVSDYIPQLYFVCNHLICLFELSKQYILLLFYLSIVCLS